MTDNGFAISASRTSNAEEILRQQLFQPRVNAADAAPTQSVEALPATEAAEENPQQALNDAEKEALKEAIQQIDQLVKPLSVGLNVQRIESINRMYVKLYDRDTGETLREIPPRKILEMKENIRAFQGLLFDKFS